jgi:leucyl aminopeptidase (aminopeptidase T)
MDMTLHVASHCMTNAMNNNAEYWNAFRDLYDQATAFLDAFDVDALERERRWEELTVATTELAQRFTNIANAMSLVSEDGVDVEVVSFGRKTCEITRSMVALYDQSASYFARQKVYSGHYPTSEWYVTRFVRGALWASIGMTAKQREEFRRIEKMRVELVEAVKEYGVARTLLNAERDYIQKEFLQIVDNDD